MSADSPVVWLKGFARQLACFSLRQTDPFKIYDYIQFLKINKRLFPSGFIHRLHDRHEP